MLNRQTAGHPPKSPNPVRMPRLRGESNMTMPPPQEQQPEPERKNWVRRHPVLSGLGIAAVAILLLGSLVDDGDPGDQRAGNATDARTSAPPKPSPPAANSETTDSEEPAPEDPVPEEAAPEEPAPEEPAPEEPAPEEPAPEQPAPEEAAPEEQVPEPAPEETTLEEPTEIAFEVTGEAPNGVDITYGSDTDSRSGNSSTDEYGMPTATLPWEESLKIDDNALYYSVTAQLNGGGDINCGLVIDGETVAKGHASGDYNICSAQTNQDLFGGWSVP